MPQTRSRPSDFWAGFFFLMKNSYLRIKLCQLTAYACRNGGNSRWRWFNPEEFRLEHDEQSKATGV
jgi:hypothetical protein